MYSSSSIDHNHVKYSYVNWVFIEHHVSGVGCQISTSRSDTQNWCNFSAHFSISLKLNVCNNISTTHGHSATCWRQEVTCFILWCAAPSWFKIFCWKSFHGQNCDISSNRVNLEVRQRLILRQRRQSCYNSTVHCPISTKMLSHDQNPGLLLISEKIKLFLTTLHFPTGPKLVKLHQSLELNRFISLYVVIAPPTGNRK